jgi:acyl-coenzyme A thioesterase PaaI-like protein
MGDRSESAAARPGVTRQAEADRRDSERVALSLLVRDAALGGSYEERIGNLSIGGVFFDGLHPPVGSRFEVRFLLPGGRDEIRAVGEVLRVSREGARFGAHVKFVEIPLDSELAIARFLQR